LRALLDINVLLALSDAKHPHHPRAQRWRAVDARDGWASCPLTQNGFLRISTQKAYSNPIAMPDALEVLRRLTARSDHQFWPDDVSLLDEVLIDHSRLLSPRNLTDVYLLALAVKHGGRLVTLAFRDGRPILELSSQNYLCPRASLTPVARALLCGSDHARSFACPIRAFLIGPFLRNGTERWLRGLRTGVARTCAMSITGMWMRHAGVWCGRLGMAGG
jgi:uncharacterized protein